MAQLDGLLGRDCSIDGGLYLIQRSLAASVHKWSNVESFARMVKNVLRNGLGRLSKEITEDIIKLQVGASQLPQTFGKGREAGLLIFCKAVGVGNPDACIDSGFVDINPTAVFTKNFKVPQMPPIKIFAGQGLAIRRKTSAIWKR